MEKIPNDVEELFNKVVPKELIEEFDLARKKKNKRMKEYYKIPEVKERIKEWQRERYKIPEVKERIKEWQKKYYQRPEVKERKKEYERLRYLKKKAERLIK